MTCASVDCPCLFVMVKHNTQYLCARTVAYTLHVMIIREQGRFPFRQNFRNFRNFGFGGKWNTFRRFVPLENSRGLRPNGTTFYQSEIPLLLPPKFPGFFPKWKAPQMSSFVGNEFDMLSKKWYNCPFLRDFDPKKVTYNFHEPFFWLKVSKR